MDWLWSDEHGIRYEDIKGIQNLYSHVLQNARVLKMEKATDRDSADMYQYDLDQ